MADEQNIIDYCGEQVRQQDHDRFLTVLFAPKERRAGLFALYAFNQELAKIRETVSEPMLGEIRLQWWREAIEEIYTGTPRKHEVVGALERAIKSHDLPRDLFDRIIDARGQDIYDEGPQNITDLRNYLAGTSGDLSRLAVRILGATGPEAGDAAAWSGLAWGLIGIARAVPYHLSLRKVFLPADLMEREGVSGNALAAAENRQALTRIVGELCAEAENILKDVRGMRKSIPVQARSLFLLNSLSRSYLKSLRKAGYHPFSLQEKSDALFRQLRLMADGLLKRV